MRIECKSEPISWLELERQALGESLRGAEVSEHLEECAACRRSMKSLEQDSRSMPALHLPASPHRPRRTSWLRWGLTLAPAMLLLLFLLTGSESESPGTSGVKGGDASMVLIRERGGVFLDSRHFAPGDRFKIELSCSPGPRRIQVVIEQDGQYHTHLAARTVACGNHLVLPGAFSLRGGAAEICAHLVSGSSSRSPPEVICTRVLPERR